MPPSGVRKLLALVPLLALAGCLYGFAGGGLPSHIRTVAVLPFENETTSPELQTEFAAQLRRDLRGRLSVREATEERADAIVRGTLLRYDTDIAVGYSSDRTQTSAARRRLQVTLDAEIVDQTSGRILWQRKGLTAEGDYNERDESEGRREAVRRAVNDIIEGAQSQW